MHYHRQFARTPGVAYIFSHAGGSILSCRTLRDHRRLGFIPGGEQRGAAADMFRRTYWDTALAASDPVLRMLRDVAGIGQVLYGTDFPYLRRDLAVKSRQRLQTDALNDAERAAVLGGRVKPVPPAESHSRSGTRRAAVRQTRHLAQRLAIRLSLRALAAPSRGQFGIAAGRRMPQPPACWPSTCLTHVNAGKRADVSVLEHDRLPFGRRPRTAASTIVLRPVISSDHLVRKRRPEHG